MSVLVVEWNEMNVNILITVIIASVAVMFLIGENRAFGQQKNVPNVDAQNDTTRPSVNITYPAYPPTVTTGKIIIEGTANDSGSGIRNVSAAVHTFPFDGHFRIKLTSQPISISPNNWSHWSVPFIINNTDSYRVVIAARDNAGNVNYAQTTINAALEKNYALATKDLIPKIAFVRPTFTEAAYQEHGFYRFYFKYGFIPFGKNITTDLDMLTVKTPRSVSEFVDENDLRHLSNITSLVPINGTELRDVSYDDFPHPQKFWLPFISHVKKVAPNAIVTVMRDEDVHDGHIFYNGDNKINLYDILLLTHNEYVTQKEYDTLRQFVNNGGTIVFIDPDVFYAEVGYDKDNHTITLVKGHGWEFDGKGARRSVPERWYNETKEWVGGNFLPADINENITFTNNPFNYTHFEEQYVNNPNAKIIIDYGIKFPQKDYFKDPSLKQARVATYTLDYGKGKVIMLGLSAQLLAENQQFMKFFDHVILPKSLCPKFESCSYSPTTNYIYGCTSYVYRGFHCDPISNEFESYTGIANFTKVTSVTRQPSFVKAEFGKGLQVTTHSRESLRADIIEQYNASQFTVTLSIMPGKYDRAVGNSHVPLVSYKNGVYVNSVHNAGWEIEFAPNNSTVMKKVRFTVFNTNGSAVSSNDIEIPISKFSQLTGTFDGKTVRIFVNGNLKSETQFTGNYSGRIDNNNFLKVGGEAYCFCRDVNDNSIFDEVRYYNYSLRNEQVKLINNRSHDILGKGLVGYWKFDGDLKDYSGFKNDMFYNSLVASMAFAPDGRLFYTEKNSGNIRVMVNDTVLDKPFALIQNIHIDWEQGLLGLAIDSKFRENHFIYAYYNYKDNNTGNVYARIVRLTDVQNKGTDQTVILDRIPASSTGFHTGGALAFNKVDDKLYVTVGDARDDLRAQNLSSLNGKTLRINRDGTIPDDNPFPNSLVYTYGHRNMYGIAFDDQGHGIVTEAGEDSYDEINSQIKGGNYGWPTMQPANTPADPLVKDSSIKPMRSYYFTKTPTQAIYYDRDKYLELKGKFIVGSFDGDLFVYKLSNDGKKLLEEIVLLTSIYPSNNVIATAVSPNGEIYFGAYDIYKLEKLDLTSKKEAMYPIQIKATNLKVSHVNYSERSKELTLDLIDRHNSSSLSTRIPRSIIEEKPEGHQCDNSSSKGSKLITPEFPYDIVKRIDGKYDVIKIQLQDEAPENFQFRINSTRINCLTN
jgi:glucose/arabinose dehydrogenase